MPAELPGFYWDEARNRYFPLSSKPEALTLAKPPFSLPLVKFWAQGNDRPTRHLRCKRRNDLWNITEISRTSGYPRRNYQTSHEILSSHYARTSFAVQVHIPTFGRIKVFCSAILNGRVRSFIGDSRGWLYSSSFPQTVTPSDASMWGVDINLHPESEISSICVSGSRCVATCFGPSAKISIQDLNTTGRMSLLSLGGVHDIWTAHLQDDDLVLGANKKAILMSGIDNSHSFQYLDTYSDVFAVFQKDHLIYTGTRNGSIIRFDKRMGKTQGQNIFGDRFASRQRTSVLHLQTTEDSQLLVSHLNGNLQAFDLRYPRQSRPITKYPGHVNTHTQRLGIALDPNQEFLFAAGEDRRIRGWSVKTGAPLLPPVPVEPISGQKSGAQSGHPGDHNNPFLATFTRPVETMQVVEERGVAHLWAACDETLYQFRLGQQI
ncbi:hypothetical protein BDZ94DRAFT_1183468 [Collybia nuda]|uniref:WD40 repeat-like protein n=1 Tax=Collybia nuda TaxID=64659 RepID=A0A9P5YHA6_9AGAR|nr:hypothetical protein BDZ94DRAFT_1183468 [Collybia nuda]